MYYQLVHDGRVETIGKETYQVREFEPESPYEYWKDKGPDQLIDNRVSGLYLDGYYLNDSSKLTDYITRFRGDNYKIFMLSADFVSILGDFIIPKFELLNFGLYQNEKPVYGYKIFRGLWSKFELDQAIDFRKSKYARYDVAYKFMHDVEVNSYSDFVEECSSFKGPYPFTGRLIVLKSEFNFDLFSFRSKAGLFCSENFKKRIEFEGLTGILFEPVKDILRLDE